MTAEIRIGEQIVVDEQPHRTVCVFDQSEYADAAGCDTQMLQHLLRGGKAEPGTPELFGEKFRAERLIPGHQQKIKI